MLKLKLQYSGHLMWRTDSLEKTLMLGKIESRRREWQRMKWLDGVTDLMNKSLRKLQELTQTHVHQVSDAIQPSHHLSVAFSCLQSFLAKGSFPMSQFFTSGSQNIEASASASVLPMNIQDWFPVGLIGLISLQSKGLSRVFSNPQFKSINSSALSVLYSPTLTSTHDHWSTIALTRRTLKVCHTPIYLNTTVGFYLQPY